MAVAVPASDVRDDRLLPVSRALSIVFIPVLIVAFLILYGAPTRTDDLFAWTIRPDMTPVVMGAGYLAGAAVFAAALYFGEWHRVAWSLLGTTVFGALMLLATIMHWDRFNHDHPVFWIWFSLYIATPIVATLLWFMNRGADPGPRPSDVLVPLWIRRAFAFGGAVQLVTAIVVFVDPDIAIEAWPWPLTPLTVRVLAAFVAFVGFSWLCFLVDDRWTAFVIPMGATVFGLALIGVGALGRTDEFTGVAQTWLFVVSLVGTLAAASGLCLYMRAPGRQVRRAVAA